MRTALPKLKSETPLAAVLNAYMRGLSTVDIITQPHDSMGVCMSEFAATASSKKAKNAKRLAQEFYQLVTLGNSLRHYEWAAVGALQLLEKFFAEYDADADRYAIENRIHCIDEYGSDDESDWEPDGEDAEGPKWKVAYKEGPEVVEHYGIFAELARYFPGNGDRSECLGSSEVADFQHFTLAVRRQTDFSINKMFTGFFGKPLTVYRQAENGEMAPMSMADEIESEINEDIRNATVSEAFDTVIFAGGVANELFGGEIPGSNKLLLLRTLLQRLVNADLPNLPSPYKTPLPLF